MDAETSTTQTCETCGRSFPSIRALKTHIRLAHLKAKASTEREPGMTETQPAQAEITQAKEAVKQPISQPSVPTDSTAGKALTPDERALVDQISRSSDDWTTIREDEILDFSLSEDPLKLPTEAKDRQERREYAYRWCERTPKRVAELTNAQVPLRWWVANSTTAPYLQKYIDPTIGGVCRLDQILLLKPWGLHQKVKDAVLASSHALYNSRELDKGGPSKIESRTPNDHIRPVTGERASLRKDTVDGVNVYSGEPEAVGDLVAAD